MIVLLDLPARNFHKLPIFDARWARRLAGAAIKAKFNVMNKTLADFQPSLFHLNHLVDTSAGRIHFQSQLTVGGAGIQAQATVHAAGIIHPTWRFTRAVARRLHGAD